MGGLGCARGVQMPVGAGSRQGRATVSLSDRRRRLLLRLNQRKTRVREGLVLVEGARAVEEALLCGAEVRFLLRSPRGTALWPPRLEAAVSERGLAVEEVGDDEMAQVAGTETPQGILAVVREPAADAGPLEGVPEDAPRVRILVLDGIQDPGNVGTLVRVAAAFGCSAVLALDGTADPWGARAVRASAGTVFRLPVRRVPWQEAWEALDGAGIRIWAADAGGDAVGRLPVPERWALALGSEGEGCRDRVLAAAERTVAVPMAPGIESLNVGMAGAILTYELTRGDRS